MSHFREEEDHQKSCREEPEGRREKKGHPEEEGKDTEGAASPEKVSS